MQETLTKDQGTGYGSSTNGKNLCLYVSAHKMKKLEQIDARRKKLGYQTRSEYFFALFDNAIGLVDPIKGV